mmetsp:Transcript_55123/g.80949  ORF Transcript_55123/g.80949 Transcript_55123/m.80949 type:complete len:152 (-) Transcript_55123:110-565(-)
MSNTAGSVRSLVSLDGPNNEPRAAASQLPGDFAKAGVILTNLILATFETLEQENHLLTKADTRFLTTLLHDEDARIIEGFKECHGDTQLFWSLLKPLLQSEAATGMGNAKYQTFKSNSRAQDAVAHKFEDQLQRLVRKSNKIQVDLGDPSD